MNDRPFSPQEEMVRRVARALGPVASEVAFVGGCATALLVTQEDVRNEVRFTDDVDVIVHVMGRGQWHQFDQDLARRGFHTSPQETSCAGSACETTRAPS